MILSAVRPAAPPPVTTQGPPSSSGVLVTVIGATVCLLPFLAPPGPLNTAPADVGMVAAIGFGLLFAARAGSAIKVPYVFGVSLLVLGGLLATSVASPSATTLLVLVTDVLLFAWAAVLALGRIDPAIVRAIATCWCRTAACYMAVAVLAYLLGIDALTGVNAANGSRASYTFGDPNLAGNYLVISLFMIAACRRPRSTALRRFTYLLGVVAVLFTGSNGAILTLVIGVVIALVLGQWRAHGILSGITTLVLLSAGGVLIVGAILPRIDMERVREDAAGSVPLLRDSIGRSDGSTSQRSKILHEGFQRYLNGDAVGIGPARTKATLEQSQASYVKEAHNDYLATLLERGLIGSLGLVALVAAMAVRCRWISVGTLPKAYADAVPRPWLLPVILPVMLVSGGFYEVLHFRHLWTWLGLIAALALVQREGRDQERAR